jgi:hypothetical protein
MSGDLSLCCSDFCTTLFITVHFCSRPLARREPLLRWLTEQSGAHRTLRWIIAEQAHLIPENSLFVGCLAWCTGQCPVRHFSAHSQVLLQFWLCPQLEFFLGLCWTLCTWDKWYLGKLVSPRGLWWTSTTKIDYRKWLSPFPFHLSLQLSLLPSLRRW